MLTAWQEGGQTALTEQLWPRNLPLETGLSRRGLGGLLIKIMT